MPSSSTVPRLRVHVVSPFAVLGGAERWVLELMDATERLEVRASLLADGPLRGELERRGVPVDLSPTGRTPGAILRAAGRLAGTLRKERPEVVLANGVKAAAVAIPAGRLAGIPVVWAKHDHSFDRRLARLLGRWADRVVATSPEVAMAVRRDDVVVVPPPAPGAPASRSEARRFWEERGVRLGDGSLTVAMLTRLVPYKGMDDAVAALARPEAAGWQLVVVGADDPAAPGERSRLEEMAGRLGVADRVRFTGSVRDAGRWVAAFDAVAVLTKVDDRGFGREGFGIAALEAMVAEVPVIGTEGGALERRLNGGGGVVVAPDEPSDVARALGRLSSREVRAAVGRAGRELAAGHPDAATCADDLVAVLSEAAARPGAGIDGGPPMSVVVPVLNEGEALDRLLEPLVPQLEEDDEVIVVDAGSTDDTPRRAAAWAERDPSVRLLSAPGANAARGRNTGVAEARHDSIACTDAGCAPHPGWLAALRTALAERSAADLVTGVYRVQARGPFEEAMAAAGYPDPDEAARPGILVRTYGRLLGRVFDPARPDGRSLGFPRSSWERAGGFPEHLDAGEDLGFGRSIAASGGRCVLHRGAEVVWDEPLTAATMIRRYARYGAGDAVAGDRTAIGRNLLRLAAYAGAPLAMWAGGRPGRVAVALGAAAYLSLPVARAVRRGLPAALLVPVALALKDLSKSLGCLAALARPSRRRRPASGDRATVEETTP